MNFFSLFRKKLLFVASALFFALPSGVLFAGKGDASSSYGRPTQATSDSSTNETSNQKPIQEELDQSRLAKVELSQKIVTLAQQFFTPEKLQDAYDNKIISEETFNYLKNLSDELKKTLEQSDRFFHATLGYEKTKKELFARIEQFSSDYISGQETLATYEEDLHKPLATLKSELEELDKKIASEKSREPESDEDNEKRRQRNIKKLNQEREHKENAYLIMLIEVAKKSSNTKEHELPERALTLNAALEKIKKNYEAKLDSLKKSEKKEKDLDNKNDSQHKFNVKLCAFLEDFKVFENEQELKFPKKYETTTLSAGAERIAVNIRGKLFELEAAVKAREHGKAIIEFSKEVVLYFPKTNSSGEKSALAVEIEKHLKKDADVKSDDKFLKAEEDKKKTHYIFRQEFDLVTGDTLIECKSITWNIAGHLEEFKRQKFFSEHLSEATKVTQDGKELSSAEQDRISNKKVLCYASYSSPLEMGNFEDTLYQQQLKVLECDITLWDGHNYYQTLTIHNRGEISEKCRYLDLKQTLVGKGSYYLYIIAPVKLKNNILTCLRKESHILESVSEEFQEKLSEILRNKQNNASRMQDSLFSGFSTPQSYGTPFLISFKDSDIRTQTPPKTRPISSDDSPITEKFLAIKKEIIQARKLDFDNTALPFNLSDTEMETPIAIAQVTATAILHAKNQSAKISSGASCSYPMPSSSKPSQSIKKYPDSSDEESCYESDFEYSSDGDHEKPTEIPPHEGKGKGKAL